MSGPRGRQGSTLFSLGGQTPFVRLIHSLTFSTEYKIKLLMGALFRSLLKVGRSSTIVALGALCWSASPALLADTLITNASIVDGMGSAAVVGSVRLTGDRITAVGELAPGESEEVIDVGGLVLAPGFIDTHSHSDRLILTERDALAKITQGIITAVVGQDGDAPYPLADFFAALEAAPAQANIAAFAGHNTLRDEVMGADFKRSASDEEIERMSALLEEELTADLYPYTYWQSNMMVLLPERDPLDLEAIDFVMAELAPPNGIIFTHLPSEPGYVGMTLTEIAAAREQRPSEAFSALVQLSIALQAATGEMGDMIIGTSMHHNDIAAFMAWPHTNICTDGSLRDRHPRGAGSFPRVLGRYVREQGVLTLEGAIHRMTGLAAEHMGFAERGVIAPGMMADLVLFNPDTVMDRATTSEPFAPSKGIHSVWVAGERVLSEGEVSKAFPGRVIRRISSES